MSTTRPREPFDTNVFCVYGLFIPITIFFHAIIVPHDTLLTLIFFYGKINQRKNLKIRQIMADTLMISKKGV